MIKSDSIMSGEDSDQVSMEIIKELGGNESDLELIELDDDYEEIVAAEDDLMAEPIKRDEVRNFIKSLGFDKLSDDGKTEKQTVKLKERPLTEDEKESEKKKKKKKQEEMKEKEAVSKKEKKKKEKLLQSNEVSSSSKSVTKGVKAYDFTARTRAPRKHLLVTPGNWKQHIDSAGDGSSVEGRLDSGLLERVREYSERLWKEEAELYRKLEERQKKGGTSSWLRTVLTSGTSSDRLAALTVLVQEAPVHNLSSLDSLLALAHRKGDRTGCMKCIQTVKELFVTELLLDDRKLRSFEQCLPTQEELVEMTEEERDRKLILCHFESSLREKYSNFISAVDKLSHDTVQAVKRKATGVLYELLAEKSEQEKTLLALLVNKLGDPEYRVAANVCHLLTKLVTKHPNMKSVIVGEVERVLYRPNISCKAQYYAVCFLNQLVLSRSDVSLSSKLLSLYFSFFQVYIKKGDIETKMLSALLTGVNRTYPFVKGERDKLSAHADTLYRVCHMASFNTSVQSLMLISQLINFSVSDSMVDRYFSALYRKLYDPALYGASKISWFLNLLYKSLKQDPVEKRVQAFIKRLLQVCAHFSAPFICASLVLLSELIKHRPALLSVIRRAEDSSIVCERFDDDDEHFVDVREDDVGDASDNSAVLKSSGTGEKSASTGPASWVHRLNVQKKLSDYDPFNRTPQYCRAELECVWEMVTLTRHCHPSVALFAQTLLKGESIDYAGDPLQDFTLVRFLDRFVFRNPKKLKQSDAGAACDSAGSINQSKSTEHKSLVAANSDEYLLLDESDVPVDEQYLYRYFQTRATTFGSRKKNKKEEEELDSDAESVEDDQFDSFLDKFERGLEDTQFDVDFASGFKDKSKKKKKKSDVSDDDLSDEEMNFDDDEDFKAAFEDEEDELMESDSLEEIEESEDFEDFKSPKADKSVTQKKSKLGQSLKKGSKGGKKSKVKSLTPQMFAESFVDADLFGGLNPELNQISSDAVSRGDRAGVKQLEWEADRERWVEDRHWKQKKRVKGGRVVKVKKSARGLKKRK